jgi:2-polyprenyl-3-methyl-5-hydroxy-6-metoxy-1,4-benzoquinol methylase
MHVKNKKGNPMKKYIIAILCVINHINSMEPQPSEKTEITKKLHKRKDYDAYAYDNIKMNIEVENDLLQWFQDRKIDIKGKTILNMDCCTGNINAAFADTAQHVHGISESKNFINLAQSKYENAIKSGKLSFECMKAKKIELTPNMYDIVMTHSMNNWSTDSKKILHNINKSLKPNGDFFAILSTRNNPEMYSYLAAQKFIKKHVCSYLDLEKLIAYSRLSQEELIDLFTITGFTIITLKEQSLQKPMSKDDIRESAKYVGRSTPLAKYIPDKKLESGLNKYADLCVEELPCIDKDKNEYMFTAFLTVVHARKIKEINHNK